KWVIRELEIGNVGAVYNLTVEQLDEAGNTELLNWATLLGAIGDQPGELLRYTPTWHHGHAIMRFLPAREKNKAAAPSTAEFQQFGGLKFHDKGFQFYRHPPASAYNLNRLLFDVRHDPALRRRLLTDLDSVADQYHLQSEGKDAAQALADAGSTAKVSDNADRIVKAGAHPLHALMSLHAVHGEIKKLHQELSKG
ncbi:MAG: hypothetical protein ACREDR_16360, partial [Blastocatellia bacterium]